MAAAMVINSGYDKSGIYNFWL